MIHMQCVVIIAGLDRLLIADWAPDSKRLPEACDENKKLVAVFLQLEGLPLPAALAAHRPRRPE